MYQLLGVFLRFKYTQSRFAYKAGVLWWCWVYTVKYKATFLLRMCRLIMCVFFHRREWNEGPPRNRVPQVLSKTAELIKVKYSSGDRAYIIWLFVLQKKTRIYYFNILFWIILFLFFQIINLKTGLTTCLDNISLRKIDSYP